MLSEGLGDGKRAVPMKVGHRGAAWSSLSVAPPKMCIGIIRDVAATSGDFFVTNSFLPFPAFLEDA